MKHVDPRRTAHLNNNLNHGAVVKHYPITLVTMEIRYTDQ